MYPTVEITEIGYEEIQSSSLKRIAENRTKITKLFIARIDKDEVEIISLDYNVPPYPLFIYYIFVEENYRRKGIGTLLLEYAETLAINHGYPSIVLQPHESENAVPLQELISWYARKGYSQRQGDTLRMEKS